MDEETGKAIVAAVKVIDAGIDRLDTLITNLKDTKEKSAWVTRIGNLMRVVDEELVLPLEKQFPDLFN
jgi:pyruvate/oxaloacetate carboxyltransferase